MVNLFYLLININYVSKRTIKLTGISGSDFIGFGNLATATNSQLSSYKPIVVINGVKNEPVESTEPLKS
jgi:hypothetical protein